MVHEMHRLRGIICYVCEEVDRVLILELIGCIDGVRGAGWRGIEEVARRFPRHVIQLWVRARSPAAKMYKGMGFRREETRGVGRSTLWRMEQPAAGVITTAAFWRCAEVFRCVAGTREVEWMESELTVEAAKEWEETCLGVGGLDERALIEVKRVHQSADGDGENKWEELLPSSVSYETREGRVLLGMSQQSNDVSFSFGHPNQA